MRVQRLPQLAASVMRLNLARRRQQLPLGMQLFKRRRRMLRRWRLLTGYRWLPSPETRLWRLLNAPGMI